MNWAIIKHSAKGSSWKNPKYIKKTGTAGKMEDTGKYYYPDSYEDGRHLPKGDKASNVSKTDDGTSDWEKKVYDHVDSIIKNNPELFKTGADVARSIMDSNSTENFKNTLKAFGVKVEDLSETELNNIRKKIASHYDKETADKTEQPSASKKSSKTKTESGKENKKVTPKKGHARNINAVDEAINEKNAIRMERAGKRKKALRHSSVYVLNNNYLQHFGILGMKWGKKNGPPYPLSASDHSASEKKAGWRKSLDAGSDKKTSANKTSNANESSSSSNKSVKDMTDEELNKALNRLRNEKAYNDLISGKSDNNQSNQANDKNSYNMKWSKNMSDKEAQDYINRLNNEKRYEELSQRDITQGGRFAKRLLVTAGTVAATTFVTTVGVKAGQAAANKIMEKFAKK